MWNYQMFPEEETILEKFGNYSTISGIIMLIIGVIAFVYPMYASLATVIFVAWMMIFAGITTGYFTLKSNKEDWLGWLKTLLLIGTGIFVLIDPISGIAAIGILFAIYFFLDGFAGLVLGSSMRPNSGWWFWSLNGFVSILLGVIFLTYWTSISQEAWLIGMYVGISLFFDGITLLFMGKNIKKIIK